MALAPQLAVPFAQNLPAESSHVQEKAADSVIRIDVGPKFMRGSEQTTVEAAAIAFGGSEHKVSRDVTMRLKRKTIMWRRRNACCV
jgi:hypothetical protein